MARFSLRALLVLVAIIAALLGYSQRHRQRIREAVRKVEDDGAVVSLPDMWGDVLWQSPPTEMTLLILREDDGFKFDGKRNVPWSQIRPIADSLVARAEELGVGSIRVYPGKPTGTSTGMEVWHWASDLNKRGHSITVNTSEETELPARLMK